MLLMSLSVDWTQLRKESKLGNVNRNFQNGKAKRSKKLEKKKKSKPIYKNCETTIKGVGVCLLSRARLFATPWTVARQAPLSMGFSRQEYWSGLLCSLPGESSRPKNRTCISCTAGRRFNLCTTRLKMVYRLYSGTIRQLLGLLQWDFTVG